MTARSFAVFGFAAGALAVLASPVKAQGLGNPVNSVLFNQAQIEAWRQGLDPQAAPASPTLHADPADLAALAEAVLAASPPEPVVIPSEMYYYFSFQTERGVLRGNLRFTDIADGVLNIGCYWADRPREHFFSALGLSDDVRVTPDGSGCVVSVGNASRRFAFETLVVDAGPAGALTPWEFQVTGVQDESGVALDLLFNRVLGNFLFVRRTDVPEIEEHRCVRTARALYRVGCRTEFVYFVDEQAGRDVLVGVAASNIASNNEFDGPFDQVPPKLPLRPFLEIAYPYVRNGSGIDEHGNIVDLPGQRVAITPYQKYADLSVLVMWLDARFDTAITRQDLWLQMTYESKRGLPADVQRGPGAPQ